MSPTLTVALLWIAFAGTHSVLSSLPVRRRLIELTGEPLFRGLYSLVAIALFLPLVWTYVAHKHTGPWLWAPPLAAPLHWAVSAGMALAFILLLSGLAKPSPASLVPGEATATGAFLITRHPLLMSIAIFGLMHVVSNGSATDIVFFGGFVIFAPLGAWHQDRRKLALGAAGFRAFYEATPFLPFSGGKTMRGIRELSPVVVAAGIGITIVLRYFHAPLFGG